ncbi:MAG: serine/threonine-protein kinase [Actinomycetota bacterium]
MAEVELGIPGLASAEPIGEGGFAVVYRAHDVDHDRWVAVKVLNATDADTLRRFDRERKTMGRLSAHEGIITILTSGISAHGAPYLVMPLLSGGSLEEELERRGSIPWPEAVATTITIADAVATAHAANVVHRDLKPANILLGPSGRPLVTDFGISQILDAGAKGTSTLAFTPAYIAPDLLDQPPPASVDVYALGVTLYEMAVGATPYVRGVGEDLIEFLGRIRHEPLPDMADVPPILRGMLAAALAKSATDRPSTMIDFAISLRSTVDLLDESPQPTPRAEATVVLPRTGTAEPTVSMPAPGADPPASAGAREPLLDWQPHLDLEVDVDDLDAMTQLVEEAVRWCFDEGGVYLIMSFDEHRFIQLMVQQNGDAIVETSQGELALAANIGWEGPVPQADQLAGTPFPLGQRGRIEDTIGLLMQTVYQLHRFDHQGPVFVQTGLEASNAPVLGVTLDRDVERRVEVGSHDELAELAWHSVLWAATTGRVTVVLWAGPFGSSAWVAFTVVSPDEIELRSGRVDEAAAAAAEIGWEPLAGDPNTWRLGVERGAFDETTGLALEERVYEVVARTLMDVHGFRPPAPLIVVTQSL